MGELEREKGAWGYVEGGMGGVSQSIARSARSLGADIFTERVSVQSKGVTFGKWDVSRILTCCLSGFL